MINKTAFLSALGAVLMLSPAQADNGPHGLWYTEKGKVAVNLTRCGTASDKLCGQIAWLKKTHTKAGVLKRDTKNDDPALRSKPVRADGNIRIDRERAGCVEGWNLLLPQGRPAL